MISLEWIWSRAFAAIRSSDCSNSSWSSRMPSITSAFKSTLLLLKSPSRSKFRAVRESFPLGDWWPVGVLEVDGVSGCEKRPNRELTRGAEAVGAYEVCDVRSGGRLESSPDSERLSDGFKLESIGSVAPCLRGLNVDILEASAGRWR